MTQTTLNKLMLTALSLGIISSVTATSAQADTIIISKTGTIIIKPSVLGASTKSTWTKAKEVKVVATKDNQIKLQTKTATGAAQTIAEEDEVIVDETKTRITAKNKTKYIITDGIAAKVNTPISINLATGEMTITNSSGTKVVTTLPDAALQKAKAGVPGLVVPTDDDDDATESAEIATDSADPATDSANVATESAVTLTNYQNTVAYQIKGQVKKRFLGIIPVSLNKDVYVSATSGNIIATEQSAFSTFLERLSF